jgi:hypothetical protein
MWIFFKYQDVEGHVLKQMPRFQFFLVPHQAEEEIERKIELQQSLYFHLTLLSEVTCQFHAITKDNFEYDLP